MDRFDNLDCRSIRQWIVAHDEHAAAHLPLYDAVLPLLLERCGAAPDQALSAACDRWRYQVLSRSGGQPSAIERRLLDLLDLAASKAAARQPRPLRGVREAIVSGDPSETLYGARTSEQRTMQQWLSTADTRRQLYEAAQRTTLEAFAPASARDPMPGESQSARTGRGRQISLFAPIYLSNHCINECPYCWFRYSEPIVRRSLSFEEVLNEARLLGQRGLRDVLLVAGDYPRLIKADYLVQLTRQLRDCGFTVNVEIAPQPTEVYAALAEAGVAGVTLYQETYDRAAYAALHSRGRKAAYDWRVETLDRAAEVGMQYLGLGVLLGLADPRSDLTSLIKHGQYLRKRFPAASLAFSLPRLHEAPTGFQIPCRVDDDTLTSFYCLLRLAFPSAQLVLSTRENAAFRNRLTQICITRVSAGSKTSPGGYTDAEPGQHAGQQFPVSDDRSIEEVKAWLEQQNFAVN